MSTQSAYKQDVKTFTWGLILALILTAIPFSMVAFGQFKSSTLLWVIAVLGLTQILVHFRFFLHINLTKQKRDDLQLILFSFLLLVIMAGGTIWIMYNLAGRMMPG